MADLVDRRLTSDDLPCAVYRARTWQFVRKSAEIALWCFDGRRPNHKRMVTTASAAGTSHERCCCRNLQLGFRVQCASSGPDFF
jgi:hypothetical protein